jgi:uncharacterized protein YwqG
MRLFGSRAEVSQAIMDVGLGQWHDQLLALARPTLRYISGAAAADSAAIGASRTGGTPDLPSKLKWPIRPPYPDADVRNIELRDHPARKLHSYEREQRNRRRDDIIAKDALLPFIAQLDLREAWRKQQFDVDLPQDGRLLFFYDAREHPYGFDPPDGIGFRALWDESPVSDLARTAEPAELAIDCLILPAKALQCVAGLALPEWETFGYEALNIPVQERDRYCRLIRPYYDLLKEGDFDRLPEIEKVPQHYLGGWGEPRQSGYMELECELVTMGFSTGGADRFAGQEAADRARSRQADWCLLAQFGCEEFCTEGMEHEWFTGLKLYFWIRRDDLASRRFENTWVLARP